MAECVPAFPPDDLIAHRNDLLANKHAEQPRQRDQRRRRRADANQHAGAEGEEEICEQVWHPAAAARYAGTGANISCSFDVRCGVLCTIV
jgi:hypothetical protein